MKFIDLMMEDFTDVIQFATAKHSGQTRKFDGKPYFTHPSRVAEIVKTVTKDKNSITAAYLHDTLEDTDATEKEIVELFGKKVLSLVKELTSVMIKGDNKAEFLTKKMNGMSKDALLIKLADRLDNVSDFPTAPRKFVDKYTKETEFILNNLKTNLNGKHKKLIKMIRQKLEQ